MEIATTVEEARRLLAEKLKRQAAGRRRAARKKGFEMVPLIGDEELLDACFPSPKEGDDAIHREP